MIAGIVRYVGLDFGLPEALHPDEPAVFVPAISIRETGSMGIPMWKYPPMLAELTAVLLGFGDALGLCEGACKGPDALGLARYISWAAGTATAGLVYAAARAVKSPHWVATVAGLLVALNPLHMETSRHLRPDVLASCFVALTLWATAGLASGPRRRRFVLAAIGIGLAGASKYNAAVVCVAPVLAHLIGAKFRARAWVPIAWTAALSALVFAMSVVWVWEGADPLADGLRHEWLHYQEGHPGFTTDHALLDAVRYLFRFGWTIPASGVLLLALPLVMRRRGPSRKLVIGSAAFVGLYLVLLGGQVVFFGRLLAPLVPPLALLTAIGLQRLCEAFPERARRFAPWIGSLIVLAPPAINATRQVSAMARPDTRNVAARWCHRNLPKSAHVATVPGEPKTPPISGLRRTGTPGLRSPHDLRQAGYTHAVVSISSFARYTRSPERFPDEAAEFQDWLGAMRSETTLLKRFEHPLPPGIDEFGSTVNHQPVIELFEL